MNFTSYRDVAYFFGGILLSALVLYLLVGDRYRAYLERMEPPSVQEQIRPIP